MNLIIGGTGQVGQLLVKQLQDTDVRFRALAHIALLRYSVGNPQPLIATFK